MVFIQLTQFICSLQQEHYKREQVFLLVIFTGLLAFQTFDSPIERSRDIKMAINIINTASLKIKP